MAMNDSGFAVDRVRALAVAGLSANVQIRVLMPVLRSGTMILPALLMVLK
jgi:hypothetical protein